MSWIYCGTNPPVDAYGTQQLLRNQRAIWCPPRRYPQWPEVNEKLWLVLQTATMDTLVLGGGRIWSPPESRCSRSPVLWTERNHPGLRQSSHDAGYPPGPTNLCFLRLNKVVFPEDEFPSPQLPGVSTGLNVVTAAQESLLQRILPIP